MVPVSFPIVSGGTALVLAAGTSSLFSSPLLPAMFGLGLVGLGGLGTNMVASSACVGPLLQSSLGPVLSPPDQHRGLPLSGFLLNQPGQPGPVLFRLFFFDRFRFRLLIVKTVLNDYDYEYYSDSKKKLNIFDYH